MGKHRSYVTITLTSTDGDSVSVVAPALGWLREGVSISQLAVSEPRELGPDMYFGTISANDPETPDSSEGE
jgi:hypothetical protein